MCRVRQIEGPVASKTTDASAGRVITLARRAQQAEARPVILPFAREWPMIPDAVREDVEKLAHLSREDQEAEQTWIRFVLTLAAGAFALLAGIQPEVSPEGLARIILAATWGCMRSGIVFGVVATYVDAARKRAVALSMAEAIKEKLEGGEPSASSLHQSRASIR